MTPHTVHLIAQLIRYQRGMYTSIEKWANTLPPSQTTLELCAATTLMREVLASYEDRIVRLEPEELRNEELAGVGISARE